jgi:release factor glutamine methyltransferase
MGISRTQLRLKRNQIVADDQSQRFDILLKRCAKGEPVQYITGETEFFGHPIQLNENVLIPRPETERLAEIAVETVGLIEPSSVLEIGTGSGCIAISLAHTCPGLNITAVESSLGAIQLARHNSEQNGVKDQIRFCQLDILSNDPKSQYDLIVSNPPYVPLAEYTLLDETVKFFEPKTALTDGDDGLKFYRRFAKDGRRWLYPEGMMILEVGRNDHPQKAAALFRTEGWRQVKLFKDYNGDPRVLTVNQA